MIERLRKAIVAINERIGGAEQREERKNQKRYDDKHACSLWPPDH